MARLARSGGRVCRDPATGRVTCGCVDCTCQDAEILFLVDSTGSMQPYIDVAAAALSAIATELSGGSCKFAVAEFRDYCDGSGFEFEVRQAFTDDLGTVATALGNLTADQGGDLPESHLDALIQVAAVWTTTLGGSLAYEKTRIVVIVSDAYPHENETVVTIPPNPCEHTYPDRQDAIDDLVAGCIHVFGFDYGDMDNPGSAIPDVCTDTGGELFSGLTTSSDFAALLCDAIARGFECDESTGIGEVTVDCCSEPVLRTLLLIPTVTGLPNCTEINGESFYCIYRAADGFWSVTINDPTANNDGWTAEVRCNGTTWECRLTKGANTSGWVTLTQTSATCNPIQLEGSGGLSNDAPCPLSNFNVVVVNGY